MSKGLFSFAICAWTAFGIATSAWAAQQSLDWEFSIWGVLAVFVVALVGTFVSAGSKNAFISFIGYMMVTIPFGLLIGPYVSQYTEASVVKVFFLTSLIVAVLGIVGAVIPDNLEGLGSWLFGGLLVLLGGYFIVPLAGFFGVPVSGALTWLDWLGIVVFSGYVIYDWNKAMRIPYTADNAVDTAVSIYLDWLNIFLRLLSTSGTKKK